MNYVTDQVPRLLLCTSSKVDSEKSQYSSEIKKAYKDLTKSVKAKRFAVNLAIQQQDRQLLLIEAPQVESSELSDAARWKVKDMIDFNIEDAVIDVIQIPNIKESKRSPMIYTVVVKRDKINAIAELCEQSGADLAVIDIPDMAQRNYASLLPEDKSGVAILSINSQSSLLTISRLGELYLSRELDTGFEHLMSSVQNSGGALESGSAAILKSLEKMVLEVQRSLDYYESQYSQPQINALYLAPFAYDVPEIKDYFSTQLGIKSKILDFNLLFSTDEPIPQALQSDTFYAVGAALR